MERNIKLDCIRSLALLFVISIHALSQIGFYEEPIEGGIQWSLCILRVIFRCCVPLFMMLTGWLHDVKKLDLYYIIKLAKIIITYLVTGAVCLVFSHYFYGSGFGDSILKILSFEASPYAWYIEMYIGLYFLLPFLNILWENLESRQKVKLIIVLFFITSAYSIFNIFDLGTDIWWLGSTNNHTKLFMEYWSDFYPVMYFFIGKYLKEQFENITFPGWLFILGILIILFFGTYNYIRNKGFLFVWSVETGYNSIQTVIVSIIIFLCVLRMRIKSKIWELISRYSLGAYLISYVFDTSVYRIENTFCLTYKSKVFLLPITIIAVLVLSVVAAIIIGKILIDPINNAIIYNKGAQNK